MGVAEAIGFQPTGGGKAAITGDFVLTAEEVNPVIRTLRQQRHRGHRPAQPHAGRAAAAVLLHFWANDDALKLAKGLRAALDKAAVVVH